MRSAQCLLGGAGTTGAGLVQATTAVGLAASVQGALRPAFRAVATGTPVAAQQGARAAAMAVDDPVRAALDGLAADPTTRDDFVARMDMAADDVRGITDRIAAGGASHAYALLSGASQDLLFDTGGASYA